MVDKIKFQSPLRGLDWNVKETLLEVGPVWRYATEGCEGGSLAE